MTTLRVNGRINGPSYPVATVTAVPDGLGAGRAAELNLRALLASAGATELDQSGLPWLDGELPPGGRACTGEW